MGRDRAPALAPPSSPAAQRPPEDRPILVVGAGVSGLCAALFLARRGFSVELWESAAGPGGLLAPVEFRGVQCDLGSHRLHGESLPILRAATSSLDWQLRPRRGALILRGRHIGYPLRLGGFLWGLGPVQAARFGFGFLTRESSLRKFTAWERDRAAVEDSDDPGFERFVRERVGESAYQAFYRPYAEKVWGLPPDELSTVVAKKRISTAHPLTALRQGLQRLGRPTTFAYPRLGMGGLTAALVDEARRAGVKFRFGQSTTESDLADPRWRHIVHSGHLRELVRQAGPESPAGPGPELGQELAHRGLYLVYLAVPGAALGPVDTYYAPEGCYWFGRVSVPRNFSPALAAAALPGETALCVEIPEGRWGSERDFAREPALSELTSQLVAARILPPGTGPSAAHQIFLPSIYPLYRRGWLRSWRRSMQAVAASGRIFPIGRQGLFLHCNIDHCVQIAADLTEHIAAGKSAAEWARSSEQYLDLRVRD